MLEGNRGVVGSLWHLRSWHGGDGKAASPLQYYHRSSEFLARILPILKSVQLLKILEAPILQLDRDRTVRLPIRVVVLLLMSYVALHNLLVLGRSSAVNVVRSNVGVLVVVVVVLTLVPERVLGVDIPTIWVILLLAPIAVTEVTST